MQTVLMYVLFIIGLVLIIKGGDWFVDSASWIAEVLGVPKFVIGATIVSVATTLPEMIVFRQLQRVMLIWRQEMQSAP